MATDDPGGMWESYPGNELTTLALPDYYSNYIAYSFDAAQNPRTGLLIEGDFPDARYMSFNIYATKQGTSLGSLTDFQIRTKTPDGNPFVAGSGGGPRRKKGGYAVQVEPEQPEPSSSASDDAAPAPENLLTFRARELEDGQLTVIIRYYVPHGGDLGGVPLPTIKAYDVRHPEKSLNVPPLIPGRMTLHGPVFRHRMKPIFDTADGDVLRFYHPAGSGQFNNADNIYLISAVKGVDGKETVLALRVKPPSFPVVSEEFDKTIVRYWSFNQGDPNTSTPFGMRDEEFRAAKDGFVYVLVAHESFRRKAEKVGYNFMEWKADERKAVILYRNMLTIPQYRGSLARVPQLPNPATWNPKVLAAHEASFHIGEQAPAGLKVGGREFEKLKGDMASPGFA